MSFNVGNPATFASDEYALTRRPLSILLAESNSEMRRVLAFVFRSDGHWVTEVENGAALRQAIASWLTEHTRPLQVGLVLAAQDIFGIPAISVLAELRARGSWVPFVLITDNLVIQSEARRLNAVILAGRLNVVAIRNAVRQAALTAPLFPEQRT